MKENLPDIYTDIIKLFYDIISKELSLNLTEQICRNLANILAIDYSIRLEATVNANDHIKNSVEKIKYFLGKRVVENADFATTLTLFAVAIANDKEEYDEEILDRHQDVSIERIVNMCFSDTDSAELENIIKIIAGLLRDKNSKLLNFIDVEPELFATIIYGSIAKHQTSDMMINSAKEQIDNISKKIIDFNKKNEAFKQNSSKLATAIFTLGGLAVAGASGGLTIPVFALSSTVLLLKASSKIGENIGDFILNADKRTNDTFLEISKIKSKLLEDNNQLIIQKLHKLDRVGIEEGKQNDLYKTDTKLVEVKEILTKHQFQETFTENKKSFSNEANINLAKDKKKGI